MKKLILIALAATALASAASVQAAERTQRFDGAKFFENITSQASSQ